jgi:hypothetical protein
MQANNMYTNATDDTLAAVTMVKRLWQELCGAVTEQEKFINIMKVVLRLLKNNANKSS